MSINTSINSTTDDTSRECSTSIGRNDELLLSLSPKKKSYSNMTTTTTNNNN